MAYFGVCTLIPFTGAIVLTCPRPCFTALPMVWILWILPESWQMSFSVSNKVEITCCHHLLYFHENVMERWGGANRASIPFPSLSEESSLLKCRIQMAIFENALRRVPHWMEDCIDDFEVSSQPNILWFSGPFVVCSPVYILLPNMESSRKDL